MVRKPRSARKTSSGPTHRPSACTVSLSFATVAALADTQPNMMSEWPPIYLVPAWIDRSTPFSKARKYSGVAQVLSISTTAPLSWATVAMAGMSCISKLCEPGASTKTARVFGLMSLAIPSPISGS